MKHNQPSYLGKTNSLEEQITSMLENVMFEDEDQEVFDYPYPVPGDEDIFSLPEDIGRKKDKAYSMKKIEHKTASFFTNNQQNIIPHLSSETGQGQMPQGRGPSKKFHTVSNQQSYSQPTFIESNVIDYNVSSSPYSPINFIKSNRNNQHPLPYSLESKEKPEIETFGNYSNFFNSSNQFMNDSTLSFSKFDTSYSHSSNSFKNVGQYKNNFRQNVQPNFTPFQGSGRKNTNRTSFNDEYKQKPSKNITQRLINSFSINHVNEVTLVELENILKVVDRIDESLFLKLRDNFLTIIKTQNGSRVFQKYLKNTSPEIIHLIFLEIKGKLFEILVNSYANYFCQKFFGFINREDRHQFITEVLIFI